MSDSHLYKHFAKENISGGSLSLCIPHTEDSSCISTLSHWDSVPLWHWTSWLQLPERPRGFVLGEHWAQSHGGLHRVTPTLLISQPFWGAQEGKELLQLSWGQKEKSFWAEGWNRLAGLSGLVPHITNDLLYTYYISFLIIWSVSISADPATDRDCLTTSLLY